VCVSVRLREKINKKKRLRDTTRAWESNIF
jgi:hypothetical protein